ncbi:MAG TPA: DoxX family membrane protein [Candidatus Binatia bacterium]|nr:DoxX family membrane protein [Candidatus Binatia bacterium]
MEHSTLVGIVEAFLRVILGWRFLISGLSNVRRWPNPVNTASILFSQHARLFGLIATVLMVGGGLGLAAGFQTPISSTMLVVFLVPTFSVHYYWLKVLPTMAPTVKNSIADDKALGYFRNFERQAFHAHEVGIRDNLVLLAAVAYFAVRGSGSYGLDYLISNWVVWIFR